MSLIPFWQPILVSAVFVFFASSAINMALKFWHAPDYRGFSNEDEVAAAMRKGNPAPGVYVIPFCAPESFKDPAVKAKFEQGPIAKINLSPNGMFNLGRFLGAWFLFCLVVSVACAGLAAHALPPHPGTHAILHTTGLAALLGYSFGEATNSIWRAQPWIVSIKYAIDGLVYAAITAATFAWLWPAAA
ncbi:MAG: hypothetical protein JSS42_00095 [Proteobacteria bacterium]|nr:hypothetical protein [Pseudomonadota bacterium]